VRTTTEAVRKTTTMVPPPPAEATKPKQQSMVHRQLAAYATNERRGVRINRAIGIWSTTHIIVLTAYSTPMIRMGACVLWVTHSGKATSSSGIHSDTRALYDAKAMSRRSFKTTRTDGTEMVGPADLGKARRSTATATYPMALATSSHRETTGLGAPMAAAPMRLPTLRSTMISVRWTAMVRSRDRLFA
jgi:hypothetical protein